MTDPVSRRAFLRGTWAKKTPETTAPVDKPHTPLPKVISWLNRNEEFLGNDDETRSRQSFALLRPPGAVEETQFLQRCTKCGDCISACLPGALKPAPQHFRQAAGTPMIDPHHAPCRLCEDFPCITACGERQALLSDPIDKLGTARVQQWDCLNALGTNCRICVEQCPIPDAINWKEHQSRVQIHIDETLCTGCGICSYACPAPNKAILILPNRHRTTANLQGGTT